ncbi:MAG TPA: hypothetical protein VL549_01205 [Gemmatimonadales bacterium]|nr:hypothetical protein [Gemmatimonadales bacterium]
MPSDQAGSRLPSWLTLGEIPRLIAVLVVRSAWSACLSRGSIPRPWDQS